MAEPMQLELEDGFTCEGFSFGAYKPAAGELVFQTGMIGYPESITDPSYRGQILVLTFPLVGNYGVPDRKKLDKLIHDIPAYFESNQIHIAALVVASYSGEEYSHYLAASSLGTWLKEQDIPAIYGVDTRLLTKRIRTQGSMLGKLSIVKSQANGLANGVKNIYQEIEWVNPNTKNLVAEGIS
jgi:carbamoyl-phosphate synthase/aspartate carbamoyltransferase